jgi:hypothetical protein
MEDINKNNIENIYSNSNSKINKNSMKNLNFNNNNNKNNLILKNNFIPKLHPSKNNIKLKKFKLCIKDFGISNYKCDRVTINFVNEYESDRIDCLSCPPNNDDYYYEDCDTQQNSEENNEKFDFSEIRKEMKNFKKDNIHFINNFNEAETVLFYENNIIYQNNNKNNNDFDINDNNNNFNKNNSNNINNNIINKNTNNNNNKNKNKEFDLITQLIKQEIEERNKKNKSLRIPYKRLLNLKLNNENNNNLNKNSINKKKTIDKAILNEIKTKKKNISIFNIIKKVNKFKKSKI